MTDDLATKLDQANVDSRERSDKGLFFHSWLSDPLRVAAFRPNGANLAQAMAMNVDVSLPGPIVELGPGTGAITGALVRRGVSPSRLVLIEADPNFCRHLRDRWPEARVLHADAYSVPALLRSLGESPAAIVSGLPLLVRRPIERFEFVLDCLSNAAPDAAFIQFTYFVYSPVPLDVSALHGHGGPMIWRNILPARVWMYHLAARKVDKWLRYAA